MRCELALSPRTHGFRVTAMTLALWVGADLALAAPVYVTRAPGARPTFTNQPIDNRSVVVWNPHVQPGSGRSQAFNGAANRPRLLPARSLLQQPASPGRLAELDPDVRHLIRSAAARHDLDPNLIKAVIHVESRFNAKAVSRAGARGLMQIMPATGRRFGTDELFDPERNIAVGARYLDYLLKLFDGNVELALAGYNAGEGAVIKHGRRIPPYRETQDYVPKVLAAWQAYASREGAGVSTVVHGR